MRRAFVGMGGLFVVAGLFGLIAVTASDDVRNPEGTSGLVVTGEPVDDPYSGPMQLPVRHASNASVMERSGAAWRALECSTKPYLGGSGVDYDIAAQDSASLILEDFIALVELPPKGYRIEREDDGRVLFSYDVSGQSKVAIIAVDSSGDFKGDEGWGLEAWAQCDPSEFPGSVTEALGIQVWQDASGNRVPITKIHSLPGPEHCDWQEVTFLVLDSKDGGREYLRDTEGVLREHLSTTFEAYANLPKNATDTGFERDGHRLWLHPDGTAAYLVDSKNPGDVERWPAAKDSVGCL